MKKLFFTLFILTSAIKVFATGEPSTRFNIFVPPNNDPVHRDVCLVITAIYDSTSFTIIDDSLDGDSDDNKTGILMAGQSYILYIRDNGINDDAQYASGGTWKQDGDYFNITSNKLIFASQSTNSDWQHDWVPSVNKSSLGEKFIIYAPKISSSNRDLNVFAYQDSTFITIKKISASATTITGYTNVNMNSETIIAQKMINRGQDLIYTYTIGRDVMLSGETYVVECSKPATVQYGALWGNERDGGGYVPSSNGSSSGNLMYFGVPYQSAGEQEIRIISWDDNNAVTLERYSNGAWVSVKSWTVNRLKAVDWVGKNNGNVSYANTFRISCTAGKKVSVFEGNWFETGSPGTSDMATMVSGENGTSSGTRFLTYMAPPGNEQNVRNPFTGSLFGQKLTHAYLFASTDTAHVTVKDAYTSGTKFSKNYTIAPGRYVDCFLTETEWKNIYNGTGTTSGAERPYLLIESDSNISVMNSNFNDNWMMYFGTSQEQNFSSNSSSSKEYTKPGDTVTVSTNIVLNSSGPVSNVSIEVIAESGLKVISSSFNNVTNNTSVAGTITETGTSTTVDFNNLPNLDPAGNYNVQTTVVTQVNYNNGPVIPNNSVLNIETITTGTAEGVPQQSVSTESVTINSSNTSGMLFSAYTQTTFNDSTDSWTCSCVDVNNDGYDDIYFTEKDKTKTNLLYLNNTSGGFTKQITGSLLADKSPSVSNTWGDIDNDGDPDLLSVNDTYKPSYLHLNNGSGSFTSQQSAGEFAQTPSYYHGAAFADYDRDGYLDLFISNYMPTRFNQLYHNEHNGTFAKIEDGVISVQSSESVGNTWADYDNDGYPDLFVPDNRQGKNKLYHNNGNGSFTLETSGPVASDGGYSVGSCWGDIDRDGDLDLFVANASDKNNYLYFNNGNGTFTRNTTSIAVNDKGHSHGCSFIDLDNDADLDLYVTNDKGLKGLYLNDGTGNFTKKTNELVTADYGKSFGQSWCDFDHDGDLDLFVATHSKQPNKLFTNNGNSNKWIAIKLAGKQSNKSAVGARVYVKAAGKWQLQEVNSQSGFGGQSSYRQHFGLGTATVIDSVKIWWPSGVVNYYTNVNPNQFITFTESDAYKISGIVFNDVNGNCMKDNGEEILPDAEVMLNGSRIVANHQGVFFAQLAPGSYTAAVTANDRVSAQSCSWAAITVTNTAIDNIQIPALAVCQLSNLAVSIGTTVLRKGFKNLLKIAVTNNGQVKSNPGTLLLKLDQHIVLKQGAQPWSSSAIVTENGHTYNTYSWNIDSLGLGEDYILELTDSVKLTATIGNTADLIAIMNTTGTECDQADNTMMLAERYVGSVDPNDKYVYPNGEIKPDQRLTYKIDFQNVGNYPASFVVITDELSSLLDLNTIKLLNTSHNTTVSIVDRTITWRMNDINLPDSSQDKTGSEGFVNFSIEPKKDLAPGTTITNIANIVFDYNDAVKTSVTTNRIALEPVASFYDITSVYPNPSSQSIYIKTGGYDKTRIKEVSVFSVKGEKTKRIVLNNVEEYKLDVSDIQKGNYLLHIILTDNTKVVKQVIIE